MAEEIITKKALFLKPSVLDSFALLKTQKDSSQVEGGCKLITFILKDEEREKNIQYALKRLIRSVGANHLCMRTGHFATLVLLLKKFDEISVAQLLQLVKQELNASNSTKSEVGDVAMGKILVCGAVLRSGKILNATQEEQKEIVSLIIAAGTKKTYLTTAVYLILVDFINTLNAEEFVSIVWKNVKPQLKKPLQEYTLDTLYFLLVAHDKFPSEVKVRKILGVEEVLCEDTIHTLCEKLMAVTGINGTNHPIYKYIGEKIANSEHLTLFWTSGIDSQLVKHNRNRELVAVNLLTSILQNIKDNVDVIPELLSKNFFKLFLDWFKGLQTASKMRHKRDDEEDHKIMIKKQKELLNALAKAMKSDKASGRLRVEVIKKLLFYPGEMNFSETTGTSITKSILADLDKDGIKKVAKLFKGVLLNQSKKFIKEDTERSWYNNERLKAAEAISYLMLLPAVNNDSKFRLDYMKLMMCFGFFKIGGDETVAVSSDLSGAIKTCFYKCLNSKLPTVDSLLDILRSLCSFINENLKNDSIKEKLIKQFPAENMECWELINDICGSIEHIKNKKKVDNVFLILLYELGLFLFAEPKFVEVAKGSIKELKSCYEHYKKEKKKSRKPIKEGEVIDEEPEWIEVLVEVLLSILSIDSSVLRSAVQCVFRLLWEYLTPSAIGQIVSVLDPDSDSNPLLEDDSSDSGSDDSDNEEDTLQNGDANERDHKSSDSDENESESENVEKDDGKVDQLRMAVQKALISNAVDTDNESIDADMIDEEEGKRLDQALSEAFKQFNVGKNKKTKKDRKDKKSLSDFRIRVLDLIDIYLEKEPSMDICLGMLAPLMRCLEFCIQDNEYRELGNRVRKTIRILTKIRKFSSTEDVTIDLLYDYLQATVEKGNRTHFIFQALGDMITECGTFIINCSQRLGPEIASKSKKNAKKTASSLVSTYVELLKNFFQSRNCLIPVIFFHSILQINWEGNYDLVPILIENAFDSNVRQFRRSEALELLSSFFKSLNRLNPDNVTDKLQLIQEKIHSAVKESLDGADEKLVANKNFCKLLGKVIQNMKKYYNSCGLDSNVAYDEMLEVIKKTKKVKSVKVKNVQNVNTPQIAAEKGSNKKKKRKVKPQQNGHLEPKAKKLKTKV